MTAVTKFAPVNVRRRIEPSVGEVQEAAAIAGARIANDAVREIRARKPDALLRAVLDALLEDSRVLAPSPALRACCERLQREITG